MPASAEAISDAGGQRPHTSAPRRPHLNHLYKPSLPCALYSLARSHRRLPQRAKAEREGAGLARTTTLPTTLFVLVLTSLSVAVEYERIVHSQEPAIPPNTAEDLFANS